MYILKLCSFNQSSSVSLSFHCIILKNLHNNKALNVEIAWRRRLIVLESWKEGQKNVRLHTSIEKKETGKISEKRIQRRMKVFSCFQTLPMKVEEVIPIRHSKTPMGQMNRKGWAVTKKTKHQAFSFQHSSSVFSIPKNFRQLVWFWRKTLILIGHYGKSKPKTWRVKNYVVFGLQLQVCTMSQFLIRGQIYNPWPKCSRKL